MKTIRQTKTLGIGLMMLSTSLAMAGVGSHGGQGVVCKDANGVIKSVQIADYYENPLPGNPIDPGPNRSTYRDVVQYILKRFSKVDPIAAKRYLSRATSFENEASFSSAPLTPIDDAKEPIGIQVGCEMAQFALQNYPLQPLQARYVVDQNIWNAADAVAKAGLVLHEVIYTDALSFGQSTSDKTRYFNAVISSIAMNGMGNSTYESILDAAGFSNNASCMFSEYKNPAQSCIVGNDSIINVSGITYAEDGTITSAVSSMNGQQINTSVGVIPAQYGSQLSVFPDGKIRTIEEGGDYSTSVLVNGIQVVGQAFIFDDNGKLASLYRETQNASPISLPLGGSQTVTVKDGIIQFFQNGLLQSARAFVENGAKFFDIDGNIVDLSKGSKNNPDESELGVLFDIRGRLLAYGIELNYPQSLPSQLLKVSAAKINPNPSGNGYDVTISVSLDHECKTAPVTVANLIISQKSNPESDWEAKGADLTVLLPNSVCSNWGGPVSKEFDLGVIQSDSNIVVNGVKANK